MKVWDILEKKCIAVLEGHTGSVKSISPHPTNPGMFTFKCVCFSGCYVSNYFVHFLRAEKILFNFL